MVYKVVFKDVEEDVGFLYALEYESIKEANEWVDVLKEQFGTDFYDIYVVEVEE